MPTYRYRCGTCGEEFEVWQSMKDPSLTVHRDAVLGDSVRDSDCDGTLVKVLSPAGIVLKGSGFYKNDSRSSNGSRSGGSRQDKRDGDKKDKESSSSDSGSSSSDSKKSDSKTESKTSEKKSDSGSKKSDSSSKPSSSTSSKK